MNDRALRYPIGTFNFDEPTALEQRQLWIRQIGDFPGRLSGLTAKLSESDLARTYRPGGWTIRQLVHHCADSHMNAYLRFKFALSMNAPTIMPYPEHRWAELPEAKHGNIEMSLKLVEGLHQRWAATLENLDEIQWDMVFIHPERQKTYSLTEATGLYAWHGRHHLAHIELALENS